MMKKEIGKRIKQRRLEQKITLKQLGERINYDYSNLSKIERGEYEASYELLRKLADELLVPVGYFFGEQVETPSDIEEDWKFFVNDMKKDQLSPDEIRRYVEIMKKLEREMS